MHRYPKELREHMVSKVLSERETKKMERAEAIARIAAMHMVPARRLREWVRIAEFRNTIARNNEQIAELKTQVHKLRQVNDALMWLLTHMAKKS